MLINKLEWRYCGYTYFFMVDIYSLYLIIYNTVYFDKYQVMVNPDAPNPSNPTLREYLHW